MSFLPAQPVYTLLQFFFFFSHTFSISQLLVDRFTSNQVCWNPCNLTSWSQVIESSMTQWLSHNDSFESFLLLLTVLFQLLLGQFDSNQVCWTQDDSLYKFRIFSSNFSYFDSFDSCWVKMTRLAISLVLPLGFDSNQVCWTLNDSLY